MTEDTPTDRVDADTQTISVVGLQETTSRGVFSRASAKLERNDVPVDTLQREVERFMDALKGMFAKAPEDIAGGFYLDEIVLTAEVSAKGSLSLLGTGGEVGATGGVSFTVKRRPKV